MQRNKFLENYEDEKNNAQEYKDIDNLDDDYLYNLDNATDVLEINLLK